MVNSGKLGTSTFIFFSLASILPGISTADTLTGIQFENVDDIKQSNLVFSSGTLATAKIWVIIQPLAPTVTDRTKKDPFTQAETYEKSVVTCNFQYYYGNRFSSRVSLKPDTGYTPNVITFLMENSSTGKKSGLNTWAQGILDASKPDGENLIISGYTSTSETDSYRQDYPSRDEAEAAKWKVCDISGITNIRVMPMSKFLVEGVGEENPIDITYVELYDNKDFIRERGR
jgi:outer membrane protein OmpA-like peptidoglycan-associated protein